MNIVAMSTNGAEVTVKVVLNLNVHCAKKRREALAKKSSMNDGDGLKSCRDCEM